jgi:nucleoside-diphosphate-sugar epimerase
MRVFVAGASGAIGQRLLPQFVARDHQVVATTRSVEKMDRLRGLGVEPLVMDGLDAGSVGEAVARAEPDVIVHQMTALAGVNELKHFDDGFAVTNALRTSGTDHLLAAAEAVGVRRFVAQSYTGWPNAREGGAVKTEDDPLDPRPPAAQAKSLAAIGYLERAVRNAPVEGIVLRYGSLYGPGASDSLVDLVRARKLPLVGDGGGVWSWIQVDDAATATVAAVEGGPSGIYNIVDDEPASVAVWLPYLAECVGAQAPRRIPAWLARPIIGAVGISMMTQVRASANARAKVDLRWRPHWKSWRDGFRNGLDEPSRLARPTAARDQATSR